MWNMYMSESFLAKIVTKFSPYSVTTTALTILA
jgi:hypothetical protein